jgi:hypothetical protein
LLPPDLLLRCCSSSTHEIHTCDHGPYESFSPPTSSSRVSSTTTIPVTGSSFSYCLSWPIFRR